MPSPKLVKKDMVTITGHDLNEISPQSLANGHDHLERKVYKIVLTGGPCGGKTTAQSRLCTFFENLGWKVFCVPETATVLLGAGVKFRDLTDEASYGFQANLIKTMMQIEKSLFDLSIHEDRNCIFICDRGVMDATAFLNPKDWVRMKKEYNWNEVELRDSRYDFIFHLMSAANGAEDFYTTDGHTTRSENLDGARFQDEKAKKAWVGHPYYDVLDNSTNFEMKMQRLIQKVCSRLGIFIKNWPAPDSQKRKFLIGIDPDFSIIPDAHEFVCEQDYLATAPLKSQARIRKRGKNGIYSYTHTIRRPKINGQAVELKMQIDGREYMILRAQRDPTRATMFVQRACFLWHDQYFTLDVYQEPCPSKCRGLVLLQTYTALQGRDLILPPFLQIVKEVTKNAEFSMYNLSRLDEKDLQVLRRTHMSNVLQIKTNDNERSNGDSGLETSGSYNNEESMSQFTMDSVPSSL